MTDKGRVSSPTFRVLVYRDDVLIFEGIPRPNDKQDYLVLANVDGEPARLECSVPDLTATLPKEPHV